MADRRSNKFLILVLGIVVAVAAAIFILTGGDLGGTRDVKSDSDLPPVTSPQK